MADYIDDDDFWEAIEESADLEECECECDECTVTECFVCECDECIHCGEEAS